VGRRGEEEDDDDDDEAKSECRVYVDTTRLGGT